MRSSGMGIVAAIVLLGALQASAQLPVDYSVYFWPDPSTQPEKLSTGEGLLERQFAIVYNVGQTPGTHSYKLLLRAFKPDGSVACEITTSVQPWEGRHTIKKVASFQALYRTSTELRTSSVVPGEYLLRAYLTEQIPAGQARQDTAVDNNQYPFEPPQYLPVEFEVRTGADEVRCVAANRPSFTKLPAGFKVPQRAQ